MIACVGLSAFPSETGTTELGTDWLRAPLMGIVSALQGHLPYWFGQTLRVYVGMDKIPAVRGGLGINVLSTPKGVLVDRDARREKVGGEVICTVW